MRRVVEEKFIKTVLPQGLRRHSKLGKIRRKIFSIENKRTKKMFPGSTVVIVFYLRFKN